jgi:hypothetical protein
MTLKPGTRLRTLGSTCEVVVVKAPGTDGELLCAGSPMTSDAAAGSAPSTGDGPLIALGKRYAEEASGLELLCVKPGPGPLTFGGAELSLKSAKPLPASD